MKKGLLIIFIILSNISYSQKSDRFGNCKTGVGNSCPRNILYHETYANFKSLNFNSINWEHTLICKQTFMMTLRIGVVYLSFPKIHSVGAPLEFNFLFGGNAWVFEAGIGVHDLYFYKNYSDSLGKFSDGVNYLAASARVGIRYMIDNALFFHVGFTPMYSIMGYKEIQPISKHAFQPMAAIGIGYTFR